MNALAYGLGTAPIPAYRGSEKGPFNLHYQVPCRETQVGSFAVSTAQRLR